jgi:hypothetical protein
VHRGLSASVCDAIIEELIDRKLLFSIASAMNYQQDIPHVAVTIIHGVKPCAGGLRIK